MSKTAKSEQNDREIAVFLTKYGDLWLRERDLNPRPPGYEPDELPSCSTPRHSIAFIGDIDYYTLFQRFCQEGAESFFAAEAEGENAAADLL